MAAAPASPATGLRRILHVGKYYPPDPGGIEVFTRALCHAQLARGHAVEALVHGAAAGSDDDRGVQVTRVGVAARLLFTPISPGFRTALREAIRRFRPDVIHAHLPNPSALWLLSVPDAAAVPLVLHWHADIVASRIRTALRVAYAVYRPLERRLLARASAIIATSPPYLDSSAPLAAWRDRCQVVPLGIDAGSIVSEPAPVSWPGAGQRVLAVGRLTYYKGFVGLVRAVSADPGASLVIVGSGEEEGRIRRAIEAGGGGDRIRLITDADDATRDGWLRSCDVLCQPSLERTEAFGLVLLEAFACGKPVIAADIAGSGAPWVVRSSGGGLVVPPGDPVALGAALERLRNDGELAASLATAGAQALRTRFRIDRVAEAVDRVYESSGVPARASSSRA